MKQLTALRGIVACVGLAFSVAAQQECRPPKEMRAAAENLTFAEGNPGSDPPGWLLGPDWFRPAGTLPAHEAKIVTGTSCSTNQQCAVVHSLRADHSGTCFLYQVIDAGQFRGKLLTYRANVRVDVAAGSVARLLVRVHRTDCSTSFRGDMGNHPVSAGIWAPYEIQAPIALDARDIEFGMQLIGEGAAWFDNVSIAFSDR